MGATPLLQVRDLRTEFATEDGTFAAVDGVSFELAAGEVLGIVGESGSGKSVTALSILGLIPRPPGRVTRGEILFEGSDLRRLSERRMRAIRGARDLNDLPGTDDFAEPGVHRWRTDRRDDTLS